MFHNRYINHKINKLYERALRIVYNDHFSSFEEFFFNDKSVTVHQRNLQILATEMYKIMNYPQILCKTFLKLKVTSIILIFLKKYQNSYIWITDHLLHSSKNLRPCTQKDETSYYSKWIQDQNENLEVTKLSLPAL